MSDDSHRKRAFVANMYPGKGWKNKVKNMSDIQVVAIYLKAQAAADTPKPEKEKENEDDIPF